MLPKVIRRAVGIGIAIVVVGTTGLSSGPAEAVPKERASSAMPRAEVSASGSDQCGKAVAERRGAWICTNDDGASTTQDNYCDISGCWELESVARAFFNGGGVYGYDGTQLGGISIGTNDHFNGKQVNNSVFSFRSTRNVTDLVFEAEVLEIRASAPGGIPIGEDAYKFCDTGALVADIERLYTDQCPGYLTYFAEDHDRVTVAHNASWKDIEHPGRWYFYVKSPIAGQVEDLGFRFTSADARPADPQGAGWNPADG